MTSIKTTMLAIISVATLAVSAMVWAADESVEDKCKAEAAEAGVSGDDLKGYVAACVADMKAAEKEGKKGSGDS